MQRAHLQRTLLTASAEAPVEPQSLVLRLRSPLAEERGWTRSSVCKMG